MDTVVRDAKTFTIDLAERVANTFWQAFVATLLISAPATDWEAMKATGWAAGSAGVAAVLSLLKGWIGSLRGSVHSASLSKKV